MLGIDIDTDIIIPTEYLALKTIDDEQYGFSPLRPELAGQIQKGDIIICRQKLWLRFHQRTGAGDHQSAGNPVCHREIFARIFFRNSIDNDLLLIERPDLQDVKEEIP